MYVIKGLFTPFNAPPGSKLNRFIELGLYVCNPPGWALSQPHIAVVWTDSLDTGGVLNSSSLKPGTLLRLLAIDSDHPQTGWTFESTILKEKRKFKQTCCLGLLLDKYLEANSL